MKEFPSEEICRKNFKNDRESKGIVCKSCHGKHHYWLQSKWLWQCSQCNFRTTLRSCTIMENSKLSFQKCNLTMAFMSFSKKGISAKEMQYQLGHSRYETVWRMMHKIREAMGKRDDLYQLKGEIEFDEGYFEKATPENVKLKRGKGSQKQVNVAVMAESTPLENIETGVQSSQCRNFKMKVLSNHKSGQVNKIIEDHFDEKSIVCSDKSKSYVNIADYVETHITEKSDKQTTKTTLKWVHIAISNAKRNLLGVYHKIKGKYLQLYLNEFCYKLNRRYFQNSLFE